MAIFAYGSPLSNPGETIGPHIAARIPYTSPWPIEYARRARLRGDGPTLVLHKTGGIVQGQLLVLDIQEDGLDELRDWRRHPAPHGRRGAGGGGRDCLAFDSRQREGSIAGLQIAFRLP